MPDTSRPRQNPDPFWSWWIRALWNEPCATAPEPNLLHPDLRRYCQPDPDADPVTGLDVAQRAADAAILAALDIELEASRGPAGRPEHTGIPKHTEHTEHTERAERAASEENPQSPAPEDPHPEDPAREDPGRPEEATVPRRGTPRWPRKLNPVEPLAPPREGPSREAPPAQDDGAAAAPSAGPTAAPSAGPSVGRGGRLASLKVTTYASRGARCATTASATVEMTLRLGRLLIVNVTVGRPASTSPRSDGSTGAQHR